MDHTFPTRPPGGSHHRRSHSDTLFRFHQDDDDDLLLDDVVSDFNLSSLDNFIPGLDSEDSKPLGPTTNHFRSLSVGADFFDGLDLSEPEKSGGGGGGRPPPSRHRHSNSMDGSTATSSFDVEMMMDSSSSSGGCIKKAMGADRLAELALLDPKRAKRILANRQSAARSKERKVRYTGELERKVQTLQTEATNLSAQVTMLQRDTTGLTAENKELKYKLQAMEQQAHLRDALNEALRDEVQRLKIAAGQVPAANGNLFSRALPPQFSSRPPMFQHFGNNQNQQLNMSQSSANNQTPSSQSSPNFLDFNNRVK